MYVIKINNLENCYVHKKGTKHFFDGVGIENAAKFTSEEADTFIDFMKDYWFKEGVMINHEKVKID
jgi:hypothetical protein